MNYKKRYYIVVSKKHKHSPIEILMQNAKFAIPIYPLKSDAMKMADDIGKDAFVIPVYFSDIPKGSKIS